MNYNKKKKRDSNTHTEGGEAATRSTQSTPARAAERATAPVWSVILRVRGVLLPERERRLLLLVLARGSVYSECECELRAPVEYIAVARGRPTGAGALPLSTPFGLMGVAGPCPYESYLSRPLLRAPRGRLDRYMPIKIPALQQAARWPGARASDERATLRQPRGSSLCCRLRDFGLARWDEGHDNTLGCLVALGVERLVVGFGRFGILGNGEFRRLTLARFT